MNEKTRQRLLRQYREQLKHKRAVMSRHGPGTAYHTRAEREAATYAARIGRLGDKL